jgi:hypothetical protein
LGTFKVKGFDRFAQKHGISDADLLKAAKRVISGNFDADLGGGVYKQRVARVGQGKSSGFRTLLAHRTSDHVFFVFGFAKNERDNVSRRELEALKVQAKTLGALSTNQIVRAIQCGALIEVEHGGYQDQEQESAKLRPSRRQSRHTQRSP